MIRFTHAGQQTDRDVPAHAHAIGPTAIEIAGWAAQTQQPSGKQAKQPGSSLHRMKL